MAVTITWNAAFEASPPDSESKQFGATRIRDTRQATRERAEAGGHSWDSATGTDGRHACGIETDGGANTLTFYKNDLSTAALTIDEDGGTIDAGAGMVFTDNAGNSIGVRRRAVAWTIPGTLATGRDEVPAIPAKFLASGESGTLVDLSLGVLTAPTGAAVEVSLLKATSNPTSFSEVTNARPTIPAGDFDSDAGTATTWLSASFTDDDWFVPNVEQIGSTVAGADLTVMLIVEY